MIPTADLKTMLAGVEPSWHVNDNGDVTDQEGFLVVHRADVTFREPDTRLIAVAPELAQRVIDQDAELQRLREGIGALISILEGAQEYQVLNALECKALDYLRALLGDQS